MKRAGMIEKKSEHWIDRPAPRLLPLQQAARTMGLTTWAMRERVWSGDIPYVKFPGGRKIYIDSLDIEKFIEKNKRFFD